MRLVIKRISSSPYATYGVLLNGETGLPICVTLERPWLENQPNISCIPKGTYLLKPYSSKKYPNVFQIADVPNRTKILIHVGNKVSQTEGCILPGTKFGKLGNELAVLESRVAFEQIAIHLLDKNGNFKEGSTLNIL
jgi:hypothetical protein